MEDEVAEIELLEQNLNKTRQISQRMTAILDSFDTRIAKLEKSILPLYTSTQVLNRRASNIEKALQKIDEVASNQEGIAAEEALILRGPQLNNLELYKDALERLNASIAFKSSVRDSKETARLVETGAKKLTQLYTKLVAEGSSGATTGFELEVVSFPEDLLATLQPLVIFLRTMPLPSTHPSHPASAAILSTLKEAVKGYADMRGNWSKKCLEMQGKRILDRADNIDPIAAGKEFAQWVKILLDVADDEYSLMMELAPLQAPPVIASTYTSLLAPLLVLFNSTVSSLISLIKQSLPKYTFLALSAYEALLLLQPRWDNILARRGSETRKETNELKDGLHALRAVCLRSFPEFLADIKLAANGKGGELSNALADFTVSTVKYLERLPDVKAAVGSALLTLGDGNWKMGEGMPAAKAPKLGEGDERVITEHYVFDVIATTVNSLSAMSRTSKRPAFGSIFLLNNIAYLCQHILVEPKNDGLFALLPRPTKDILNSNFRTAKAGYFDSNFSPLMQALTDDPKEKSGKSATKEKFTRFFDLLEEVVERHKMAKVLEEDPDDRETIGDEVVKLVVPSLQRFTQKHREKQKSKNPQKYIKMTPEAVEAQLRSLFQ